jgi:hypothetical protein
VVINNFNLMRSIYAPHKTDPPLIVNANTVLPFSIDLECFELISGRHSQAQQIGSSMQLQQLPPCDSLNIFKPWD